MASETGGCLLRDDPQPAIRRRPRDVDMQRIVCQLRGDFLSTAPRGRPFRDDDAQSLVDYAREAGVLKPPPPFSRSERWEIASA